MGLRSNVGTAVSSATGTSMTVNRPTDSIPGDKLWVVITNPNTGNPVTPPDDSWRQYELAEIFSPQTGSIYLFEKICGPKEPSSYTFVQTDNTHWATMCIAGTHDLRMYDCDAGTDTTGSAHATGTFTSLFNNDLVVSFFGQDNTGSDGSWVASSPGGLTELAEVWASGNLGLVGYVETRAAAGAGNHQANQAGGGAPTRGSVWVILGLHSELSGVDGEGRQTKLFVSDAFNRADADDIGANWEPRFLNDFDVVSNAVRPESFAGDSDERWIANIVNPDQWSQIIIGAISNAGGLITGAGIGVCLRNSDFSNYYRVVVSPGGSGANSIEVTKTIGGSFSVIAVMSAASAWVASDVLRAEVERDKIIVYKNGVVCGVTSDTEIKHGQPGIAYSSAIDNATIDSWSGGDLDNDFSLQMKSLAPDSYWRFSQGSMHDSGKNNFSLNRTNVITIGQGSLIPLEDTEDPMAAYLDGLTHFLHAGDNYDLSADQDWTIAGWWQFIDVNEYGPNFQRLYEKRLQSGDNNGWLIYGAGSGSPAPTTFDFDNGATLEGHGINTRLLTAETVFLVFTWEGSTNTLRCYRNGSLIDTYNGTAGVWSGVTPAWPGNTANFAIGSNSAGTQRVEAFIDEIGIWEQKRLTDVEINRLWEAAHHFDNDLLDHFDRADGAMGSNYGVAISTYPMPSIVDQQLDWPQFPSFYYSVAQMDANQYAYIETKGEAEAVYFLLRLTNPNSGSEVAYVVNGQWGGLGPAEAWRMTAGLGAMTSLGFANGIMQPTDKYMRADIVGTVITLYGSSDGIAWSPRQTWNDSVITGPGYVGLYHQNNVWPGRLDGFGAGSLESTEKQTYYASRRRMVVRR